MYRCVHSVGGRRKGRDRGQLIEGAADYKKLAQKGGAYSRKYSMLDVFFVTRRTNATVSSPIILLLIIWF